VKATFGCVATGPACTGSREFSHLDHAGMGSKRVPSYRNGVVKCTGHHHEYHQHGREAFEERFHVKLSAVADWLAREFDGDFLLMAEEPPIGVWRLR